MKTLIWRFVYNKLMKCDLFRGVYDAKNGSESYMNGICTVMEYIAEQAHMYDEFEDIWMLNMKISQEKVKNWIEED